MKCAVYIRVSSKKEEQKTSLVNQQRFFYNVIAEKRWELYQFYIDVESGTKDKKRGNLKRMIEDAKKGLFDVIISKELSRLARNGKLSYEIKDVAENNGVHIITFDNAINSTEGNVHMFGLYAWVYEQESQRTSERIKAALFSKAQKGEFIGSIPPYGYQVVNKKLIPTNDYKPEVVKNIFQMYLSGMGFDSIARTLSNQGYPTPATEAGKKNAGQFWYGSSVKSILRNPHYTGDLVQHRETTRSVTTEAREAVSKDKHLIIKNAHPALITHEDFETAQKLMKTRKTNITKPQKHLFTNFLYCSDCGSGMWYRQNRAGYICGGYARHGNIACTTHTIKEQTLVERILSDIKEIHHLITDESQLSKLKSERKAQKTQSQVQVTKISKTIQSLKSKKKRYIDLLAENVITENDYREISTELEVKIKHQEKKRSELDESLHDEQLFKELESVKKIIAQFLPLKEVSSDLLSHFVNRIEVNKQGKPFISYRFSVFSKQN
ncbi:recombinase family protein [Salipaludibacillus aurantiacus]|uniref:Site-specific DNA recombinase n=1 Tax=Salipaludibacillus aurantiacus TaxID=1601833 RepID=A0A1H9UL38_9BACI|nr:recombinase family protein [Salipaludibacillus aurantiacus]SES10166.1 Site-specific DNA recombinase [Salipaludibacillus aurantiacus]